MQLKYKYINEETGIQMVQSHCQTKARDRVCKGKKPEEIKQTSVLFW